MKRDGLWFTLVALGLGSVFTGIMLFTALPQWDVPYPHVWAITGVVVGKGLIEAMIGFIGLWRDDRREVPEHELVREIADLLAKTVDDEPGSIYHTDPVRGPHSIDYIEEWEDGARAVIKRLTT